MTLNIAHVLLSLSVGGGERLALLLADRQVRAGHRVIVVSFEEPPEGALRSEFEDVGASVVAAPKRPGGFDPTLPPRLAALFRREGSTVVHTHNPMPLVYASWAAKLARARVVHTKHGPHPAAPHRLWMRRIAGVAVDSFVAVSEATHDFARELREVDPGKLSVIINATDLERFRADPEVRRRVRGAWGIDDDAFVVGTVGRVAEVKNHELLLRAVAPLLDARTHLVIAGDGPERKSLSRLADRLGVSGSVRLLGMQREVAAVMNGFDVFALSSNVEGLPLVLTEAMGCRLPVVATRVGGVPKVVDDGASGLLVPPRDPEALRAAIQRLRDAPDLRAAMGGRGRAIAEERYSVDRMAREYVALYRGRRDDTP